MDDVLYTGSHHPRRAGRSSWIWAVLPPSSWRCSLTVATASSPSAPDYVGKNVPSSRDENVRLFLEEVDGTSAVEILDMKPGDRAHAAPLGGE